MSGASQIFGRALRIVWPMAILFSVLSSCSLIQEKSDKRWSIRGKRGANSLRPDKIEKIPSMVMVMISEKKSDNGLSFKV